MCEQSKMDDSKCDCRVVGAIPVRECSTGCASLGPYPNGDRAALLEVGRRYDLSRSMLGKLLKRYETLEVENAKLKATIGWVAKSMEMFLEMGEPERNAFIENTPMHLRAELKGCDGPAAYDALDCKNGKIPKKDWCGCCIANAALKECDDA